MKVRFSLKTLFAIVTVLAILCGWFAFKMGEARHQRRIVDQLQELHVGVIYYDPPSPRPMSFWERRCVQLLGPDFCFNVTQVNTASTLDDSRLEQLIPLLKELPKLEFLNLNYANVTDTHLKELVSVKSLKRIRFFKTKVTDQGIEDLKAAMPHTAIIYEK